MTVPLLRPRVSGPPPPRPSIVSPGVLQNFARKYTIAIDDVGFESIPTKEHKEDVTAAPADGVFVYGMFIDGCKWDYGSMTLADSDPKVCEHHDALICFHKRAPATVRYKLPAACLCVLFVCVLTCVLVSLLV